MKLMSPDFENSILNVSNSLLQYYNVTPFHKTHPYLDKVLEQKFNHIIYILLDGLGHNVVSKMDHNKALKVHMKQGITSIFPPTTVAATNTVLSAKTPIETGYLGWVQYFEKEDTDLAVFLNKDFYTDVEQSEVLRNKYLKYDNILTLAKKQNPDLHTNIFFPNYIEDGTCTSFKDGVEKTLLVTHNTDASFNYLYWIEPDLTEHKHGIDSKETLETINKLSDDFEELINNIDEDTLVICIADHGLTNIEEINIFNYPEITEKLKRKPSIEPRAINFFVKDEYKDTFKDDFNKLFEDKYKILSKKEVFDQKIFGDGTPHKLIDMFVGDYLAIAIDKYMFSVNDKKSYIGHHAGLTKDEMLVPLIVYKK